MEPLICITCNTEIRDGEDWDTFQGQSHHTDPDVCVRAAAAEEKARADRYERALRAIQKCTLVGVDFGDYVQALVDDVLEGGEAECWNCGTIAHEGPCVGAGSDAE